MSVLNAGKARSARRSFRDAPRGLFRPSRGAGIAYAVGVYTVSDNSEVC
jgi:hypothetical protein